MFYRRNKMKTVSIRKETAITMLGYMLGVAIVELSTTRQNGTEPRLDTGIKNFVNTLESYLKEITGENDIQVYVDVDYYMSISLHTGYEYAFKIGSDMRVEEHLSNSVTLFEKLSEIIGE
jgi:hypothetical protein